MRCVGGHINTYHSLNKKMNINMVSLTINEIKIPGNQFSLQKLSKPFTQALRLASLFRSSQCKDIRRRLKTCLNLLYDSMLSKLELYNGNCTKLKHLTFVPFSHALV